jgi:transcriptional adapter 3
MSGKAAKGKGKSRGGAAPGSSQRHSRSRNTTPASGSAFSQDTHSSDVLSPKLTYEDMLERFNISDSSSIPSAANLAALRANLSSLDDVAKSRSRTIDTR